MTNVLMHDSRRLVLPLDTMVDVLIEFDQAHKRWPERAIPDSARLVPSGMVVSVRQSGQDTATERNYSLSTIAAAIIHYCAKMRVPVPRNASKSVMVTPDGITMVLEGTLMLQRQHRELPHHAPARPRTAEPTPEQAVESVTEQALQSDAEPAPELATESAAEPVAESPRPAASDSFPTAQSDAVPAALDAGTEGKEAGHSAVT